MKYILKVFKGFDARYIPVSPANFLLIMVTNYAVVHTYYFVNENKVKRADYNV